MWSKTGHENSLAAENMGNDIVNEARTRQQKPPSSPAKTNKIGRFQHRRRQEWIKRAGKLCYTVYKSVTVRRAGVRRLENVRWNHVECLGCVYPTRVNFSPVSR